MTHRSVQMTNLTTADSIALGRARVTIASGSQIQLKSAFVRGDSILGTEEVAATSSSPAAVRALPLDSVRVVERRTLDVLTTIQWMATVVFVVGAVQFFSGAGACC